MTRLSKHAAHLGQPYNTTLDSCIIAPMYLPPYLCQDLPRHDDDLRGLKRDEGGYARDHPSRPAPAFTRHHVRYHGNGDQKRHDDESDRERDASGAVGALAARFAQLGRVPFTANGTICCRRNRPRGEKQGSINWMVKCVPWWRRPPTENLKKCSTLARPRR